MIELHEHRYSHHTDQARLLACGLTPLRYRRMLKACQLRRTRESAIPQEDVDAIIDLISEHPQIGAGKAHHTLIDREAAYVSSAYINQAKQQMTRMLEDEYRQRKEAEKTLEQHLRELQPSDDYQHIQAEYPNHIWATDFLNIRFIGYSLCICVVYDIHTQAYLSILGGSGCDQDLAHRAITQATERNNQQAAAYLRRDNGKAFITDSVQKLLDNLFMQDSPIPPSSPWFNGSLESNNSSLRTTIKTIGMQELADDPSTLRNARRTAKAALTSLQTLCDKALDTLNCQLSRPKFKMPPQQVMDDNVETVHARHASFKEQRKLDRKKRMAAIRQSSTPTRKSYRAKVRHAIKRKLRQLSTNNLFIINETIHGRFEAIEL